MSEWKRGDTWGGRANYRREIGGDRLMAYVDYNIPDPDLDGDRELPYTYDWSVQDGSCGRILESGWVDGEEGLEAAQHAADEAAARLFPEHA